MKKREQYRRVVLEPAKSRIENKQCPACAKPKDQWTRSTRWLCCCPKCTATFNKKYVILGWPDLRNRAFRRDKHTCVKCGEKPTVEYKVKGEAMIFPDYSKLVADHIIPIALGGDQWNIDNVQTLCIQCDKIKTREDQGKIARQRHIDHVLIKGQQKLI